MVIRPGVYPLNRRQRAQVRVDYRTLRSGGVARVHAHTVVRSLLDVGMAAGSAAAAVQRQWGDGVGPDFG